MATKPNGTTTTTTPTPTPTPTTPTTTKKPTSYNPKRIPYRPNHHRHNRRSCCSCRCCCCWTILVIFVVLLLAAIAGATFYFLYRPQLPSFSISSLKISRFNLTTSPADDTTRLTTKLNVTLSTRNRNKKLVYSYDPIAIRAETTTNQNIELANGNFPSSFTSPPNNVTMIHSTLSIVSQILDVDSISSLKLDIKRKNGLPMRIILDTKIVVNMDKLKSNKVGIRVTCDGINGQIPKGKNPAVASITTSKCKVDLRIKILRWTF